MTRPRAMMIGLDGADLQIVRAIGQRGLPTLHRLMHEGAYASMPTNIPHSTLPNWASVLTGYSPGEHGVFDFTRRDGYRVCFDAPHRRERRTIFSALDEQGIRCTVVGFPGTWPPEPLKHGIFVSGWDSPVAFEADASFVSPRELYDELRRFGTLGFDTLNQFRAGERWTETLADALVERIESKTNIALHLLRNHPCEVFAFYFGESDTAAHHLWSLHDEASPRRPRDVSERAQSSLTRVYAALDRALERMLDEVRNPALELTVVSDHGSGGSSDKVLYLNRFLADAGLLAWKSASKRERYAPSTWLAPFAKDVALRTLPGPLRQRLFRAFGTRLPGVMESQVRFGAIDMKRTRVFSDELNYFPSLHWNLQGREPHGTVPAHAKDALFECVRERLLSLRDPWTGLAVVKRVLRREEVYQGPYVNRAPDILLEFFLDRNYSYNLMPSSRAPAGTGVWRRLSENEYLGRKGKSLPGSHRPKGLWIGHGPRLSQRGESPMHINDVAADFVRRGVPEATLFPKGKAATAQPSPALQNRADTRIVERRLQALGYIE